MPRKRMGPPKDCDIHIRVTADVKRMAEERALAVDRPVGSYITDLIKADHLRARRQGWEPGQD
jgi:hypothetical protein